MSTYEEFHGMKTDLALIKKDVKQIEKVFQKLDVTVEQMTNILKTIAVQENILVNNEKRIDNVEDRLIKHSEDEIFFRKEINKKLEDLQVFSQSERERRHKEILESIEKLNLSVNEKIKEQNESLERKLEKQNVRLVAIERWKWYVGGVFAVLVFLATKIAWSSLFGG
jgi:hypothetical protein